MFASVVQKIQPNTKVFVERQLASAGKIDVKIGDEIKPFDVVGESGVSRFVKNIDAPASLGISPENLGNYISKKEGEPVVAGEIIAQRKGFAGLRTRTIEAPFSGTLEGISDKGIIRLKSVAEKLKVLAGVSGKVIKTKEDRSVLIEANATLVKGVWATGNGSEGEIKIIASPEEIIEAKHISSEVDGKIVVGGSLVTRDVLKKAAVLGVKGIVCGGIDFDVSKDARVPLLITEGFGRIPMNKKVFEYLKGIEARFCLLNVDRMELIVPEAENGASRGKGAQESWLKVEKNQAVQVFMFPYFGWEGKVVEVYDGLREMNSGVRVEAVRVKLDKSGDEIDVPVRNLGILM